MRGYIDTFDFVHDISPVTQLSGLSKLVWAMDHVAPSVSVFSGLPALRELSVSMPCNDDLPAFESQRCQTRSRDYACFSSLQHLTSLQLHGDMITTLQPLEAFTQLVHLQLMEMDVHDLRPLTALKQLNCLVLIRTDATCLSPLTACTSLSRLQLSGPSDRYCHGQLTTLTGLAPSGISYGASEISWD